MVYIYIYYKALKHNNNGTINRYVNLGSKSPERPEVQEKRETRIQTCLVIFDKNLRNISWEVSSLKKES